VLGVLDIAPMPRRLQRALDRGADGIAI